MPSSRTSRRPARTPDGPLRTLELDPSAARADFARARRRRPAPFARIVPQSTVSRPAPRRRFARPRTSGARAVRRTRRRPRSRSVIGDARAGDRRLVALRREAVGAVRLDAREQQPLALVAPGPQMRKPAFADSLAVVERTVQRIAATTPLDAGDASPAACRGRLVVLDLAVRRESRPAIGDSARVCRW